MKNPNIVSIQRYSIHDGDGIRTTVFFKGCLLNCWWCHNPESQSFKKELMFNKEKCSNCLKCTQICENNTEDSNQTVKYHREKCKLCETCLDICINNAREIVGKEYSVLDLIKEVEKDSMFYESSYGGVTLSGGEVMVQDIEFLTTLVKRLKKKGYNIAIDTCGFAPQSNYESILPYVDTFLYDIKLMDSEKHIKYMGKDNELILSNLEYINKQGVNIYIRIPVIGGVNDNDEEIDKIINYLKANINVKQVNLLPYHDIAASKYERLDIEYKGRELYIPSKEKMECIKSKFITNGFNKVEIGG
ncbi:trans-4-hydroxy-L-proline dehydratase activase [Romboutsia sp.]|uniref:trans-4-hydroxy-L-proline dehydratase activase n=1 Tax=Romboutsia sp. TaxID=1965302 RepID=UPI003F409250